MMALTEIPGIGESLAQKLVLEIGSLEDVERALEDGDVSTLSGIEGISPQRAVKLINSANGRSTEVTTTDEGRKLHKELINGVSDYIQTRAAKERISIITPLAKSNLTEIISRREWSENAIRFVTDSISSFESWNSCISGLSYTKEPTSRIERVIVVPNAETIGELMHINNKCRVLVRSEEETWRDYVGLPRVTWIGKGAPEVVPSGWVVGKSDYSLYTLVPEVPLQWLKSNSENLSIIASLSDQLWPINIIGQKISESLEGLEDLPLLLQSLDNDSIRLESLENSRDGLWGEVKSIEAAVNDAIVSGTSDATISFDGDEVLSYYSDIGGLERRLRSTVADTIDFSLQDGLRRLSNYLQHTGVVLPNEIYSSEYPCVINRQAIELIESELDTAIMSERSDGEIAIANSTIKIMKPARKAISKFIEIDMWLGIARWAVSNRCTMPELSTSHPGVWMKDGRHILLGCEPDPVTYGIGEVSPEGEKERIALLSGANSGGKTTLLETLGSVILLAHSGLPVPASQASVGLLDELHMLAKVSGTQSAGALERTLKKLAEVLVSDYRKVILADELEAITEPGSASLILGGLLAASCENKDTNVLLVTHIGTSISEVMGGEVRIDGIEAQGLDENMDLIVDRTPKRNHIAKSTPELIVRRLAARSTGPTSKIFSDLLERF
jgi:ribosomal protein S13